MATSPAELAALVRVTDTPEQPVRKVDTITVQ